MKPLIYLIESGNRQDLAETFMRFQEYYESPVFRGRAFSRDEFEAWYASENGAFTYCQDWSGFNIPSWVLEPFKNGDFDPLTKKEKKLINLFKNVPDDFYIIGATSQDEDCPDTIKHEFTHGAFSTCAEYRNDVVRYLNDHGPSMIKKALRDMSYGDNVLDDEANAYLLTEPETFVEHFNLRDGHRFREVLDKIFYKYFGFSMASAKADLVVRHCTRLIT